MEYTGLLQKYPVNRELTSEERQLQLKQKHKLEIEPAYQLSVIKMNSTFMEVVDKYYGWKGVLTTTMLAGMAILCVMSLNIAADSATQLLSGRISGDLSAGALLAITAAFVLAFGVLPVAACIWLLRKESFTYTHYPIRLNRKTRMVHVFRLDGTVLSVPWDKLFITFGRCASPRHWDVRAHVMDKDGVTVRESFSLSEWGVGDRDRELLKHYWEFVRRYMEDGPQAVIHGVHFCLPIESKREPVRFGVQRQFVEATGMPLPLRLAGLALALVLAPGRWFAMRTSKIPVWPKEIDDACSIEPGDPYIKDAGINPPDLR